MSDLKKYHYNTITNRMNKCDADVKECPLGGVPHVKADNVGDAKILYEAKYKDSMKNESYLGRKRVVIKKEPQSESIGMKTKIPENYLSELSKNYKGVNTVLVSYYHGGSLEEIRNNVVKDYEDLVNKHPYHKDINYLMGVRQNLDNNVQAYLQDNHLMSSDYHEYDGKGIYKVEDAYYKDFSYQYSEGDEREEDGYKPPFSNPVNEYPDVVDVTDENYYIIDEDTRKDYERTFSYKIDDKSLFKDIVELKKIKALESSYNNIKNKNLPDWMGLPPVIKYSSGYFRSTESINIDKMRELSNTFTNYRELSNYKRMSDEEYYDNILQETDYKYSLKTSGAQNLGDVFKELFTQRLSYYYPSDDVLTRMEKARRFVKENPDSVRKNIDWMIDMDSMLVNMRASNVFN